MEYILNIGLDKSARYGRQYRGKRWQYQQALRKIARHNLNILSMMFVQGVGKHRKHWGNFNIEFFRFN